ncbi:MAG: precorrin-2 C(20)-methyltransferase [Lachnospiraceae bacterium]|nr:precorrin-2 C(20)-methyltransferase [Lachnospiraceae bacterium]
MNSKSDNTGILYGIGVGPGDFELMTLKAVRIIGECDVLILPTETKENCHAYNIAKETVENIDDKDIICKRFLMTKDEKLLEESHRQIAGDIEKYLDEDKKVGFLTIGDPSIYSTFAYVQEILLERGKRVETVSGIPSFCAAAARIGISLSSGSDEIHVISANHDIKGTSQYQGTRIYMKSGRKLKELIAYLKEEEKFRELDVYIVANCGMENERVWHGLTDESIPSEYLTIVIVKEKIINF